jgi:hypothetical protein
VEVPRQPAALAEAHLDRQARLDAPEHGDQALGPGLLGGNLQRSGLGAAASAAQGAIDALPLSRRLDGLEESLGNALDISLK